MKSRSPQVFLAAAMVGTIGAGIFGLASIVSVSRVAESNLSIGLAYMLTTVPALLLAPLQGVLIDRFMKARLALWAGAGRAALAFTLAASAWLGRSSSPLLYGVILLYCTLWLFSMLVTEGMVKEVMAGDRVVRGMSFVQAAWQVGALGSAVGAGFLIREFGLARTFALSAGADAVGAALFWRLASGQHTRKAPRRLSVVESFQSYAGELREGWRYILATRRLLPAVVAASAAHPFFQAINTLLVPFNYRVLGGADFSLGLLDGAAGLGSLVSAGLCLAPSRNGPRLLLTSIPLLVLSLIAFACTRSIGLALMGYAAIGLFAGNMRLLTRSMLIQATRSELSGRVLSAASLIGLSAGLLTSLGAGWLADRSLLGAYVATGLLLLLPLAAAWRSLPCWSTEAERSSHSQRLEGERGRALS